MSISIRFRWVPFVATVLIAGIGIQLGNWQSQRASDKTAIEAAMAAQTSAPPLVVNDRLPPGEPREFRRVTLTGRFVSDWPVYLDNRPHAGAPGFYVVMPFRLSGGTHHVLVARGWAPRQVADRARVPAFDTPVGEITVDGIVRTSLPRVMDLGDPPVLKPGSIVQNLSIPEFESASRLDLHPFFVQQTSDTGEALVREWPVPSSGIAKHQGYAFQWYGLSLMAVLFFIVTGIRREPS